MTYRLPVCALQFNLFFKSGDILRASLDSPTSAAEALALIREFSASECFGFVDERLTEARQNATTMAAALRNDILTVMYASQPAGANSTTTTNRRKRSASERVKRQATSSTNSTSACSTLDSVFTPEEVRSCSSLTGNQTLTL